MVKLKTFALVGVAAKGRYKSLITWSDLAGRVQLEQVGRRLVKPMFH